jgi:hypothetical protein
MMMVFDSGRFERDTFDCDSGDVKTDAYKEQAELIRGTGSKRGGDE